MANMTPEERNALRAQQDAELAMEEEVIDRMGLDAWHEVQRENTYHRPGETIEFYRDADGVAHYRFRPLTPTERQEQAEGRVEDQL